MKFSLYGFICVVCLVVLTASSARAQTTALFLDSQPGDYIGQGETQTWTSASLPISVERISASYFRVRAQTADFQTHWVRTGTPDGAHRSLGDEDASRALATNWPGWMSTDGPRLQSTRGALRDSSR